MYKITRVQTRPNTNVEFWGENNSLVSDAHRAYRQSTYVDSGKFLSKMQEFSADQLTRTTVTIWANQEVFEEFISDSKIIVEFEVPGNRYMLENGIETISKTSEII